MTDSIKHTGRIFTPDFLVKDILDEAGYNGECILRRHCIDNSCGDGAFLCEIVRRYLTAYRASHGTLDGAPEEIREFIHGIEIDRYAVEYCAANIATVFSEFGIEGDGIDLRLGDALDIHDFDGMMDFVVGNPPYVRVHNLDENFDRVKKFSFAAGGMTDLYLVFFEIGFNMLRDGGKLCYITPSSWINSVAGYCLRQHIMERRDLVSIIDLGHFQPFRATTYTAISLFHKGAPRRAFAYYSYNSKSLAKNHVCDMTFESACIDGKLYLADNDTLATLRNIFSSAARKVVTVKNGFATLADKIFISDSFPFSKFTIPVLKASTGKWYKALFPYKTDGKPLPHGKVFSCAEVADYLEKYKADLLNGTDEADNPDWYLFGRTQALKDVYTDKLAINTTIKDTSSIKLNPVPAGSGIYSGLYIITEIPYDTIREIIISDRFINYVASLKKYKSGGYYTFNSKDLETYLNHTIARLTPDTTIL